MTTKSGFDRVNILIMLAPSIKLLAKVWELIVDLHGKLSLYTRRFSISDPLNERDLAACGLVQCVQMRAM